MSMSSMSAQEKRMAPLLRALGSLCGCGPQLPFVGRGHKEGCGWAVTSDRDLSATDRLILGEPDAPPPPAREPARATAERGRPASSTEGWPAACWLLAAAAAAAAAAWQLLAR